MILIKMQRLISVSGVRHLCIDPQSFILNGLNFGTAKQKSVGFFFFLGIRTAPSQDDSCALFICYYHTPGGRKLQLSSPLFSFPLSLYIGCDCAHD